MGEKKEMYVDVDRVGMVVGIRNKLGLEGRGDRLGVLMVKEEIGMGRIGKMMGEGEMRRREVYGEVREEKI